MKFSLRLLYLYLFSFVGLIITVIGSIQILNLALKTYVFQVEENYYYPEVAKPILIDDEVVVEQQDSREIKQDYEERQRIDTDNQRKRQLSNSLASIMIGVPLYLYHWQTIKKEQGKKS